MTIFGRTRSSRAEPNVPSPAPESPTGAALLRSSTRSLISLADHHDRSKPHTRVKETMAVTEFLEQARSDFERRVWGDAYDRFSAADDQQPLSGEDLERLAVAAQLVGKDDVSAVMWERAHIQRLERGDIARAVRCAFWLALGDGAVPRAVPRVRSPGAREPAVDDAPARATPGRISGRYQSDGAERADGERLAAPPPETFPTGF